MSKFVFNSFAKKKLCINIKSQVSWAWVGESRRSRKYGFPANQFRKGSMHSVCYIQIVLMVYLILEGFFTRR